MTIDRKALRRAGYAKARSLARKYYYSIGSLICPALGHATIIFNAKGFHHLVRKKDLRSKAEQRQRFALLTYVEDIIGDRNVVVTQRYVRETVHPSTSVETRYWGLKKEYGRFSVRIVIRQIRGGNKHFYSIMRV